MSIADYTTYKEKLSYAFQRNQDTKISRTTVTGRSYSFWDLTPFAGAAPTTAVAPTSATTGAMGQLDSSGTQRLAQVSVSLGTSGYMIVCDRLSHQGGLSGTTTTAQTTNLPTAALTRYTNGVGVMAALEIYTAVGATAADATVSYTNTGNTSGQISPAVVFGSTGHNAIGRFIMLPLAAGDIGVKSVESVTLSTSTLTAGNFGVTLYKPLFVMPVPNLGSQQFLFDSIQTMSGNMPEIVDGACLFYLVIAATTSTGIFLASLRFIEE